MKNTLVYVAAIIAIAVMVIFLLFLWKSELDYNHRKVQQRIGICRTIEDGTTKALCISVAK